MSTRSMIVRTFLAGLCGGIIAAAVLVSGGASDRLAGAPTSRVLAPAAVGTIGARPSKSSSTKVGAPIVRYAVPAISPPLRDLGPSTAKVVPRPESFEPAAESASAASPFFDQATQSSPSIAAMAPPLGSFDGLTNRENFTVSSNHNSSRPPDNHGDVGPNHYVQWINTVLEVFDKDGNPLGGGPKSGEQLFQNLTQPPDPGHTDVCATTNQGDPLVLYDQLADRWVLTQFAFNIDPSGTALLPPFNQCVAVSTTPDPTGTYCTYSFLISAESLNDYPKIGLHPTGYYFSYNMFAGALVSPGAGVQWVDRAAMLSCDTAASVIFTPATNPALALNSGLLPADLDGTTLPPANSPEFYVGLGTSTSLELWKFNINLANPANSTFSPTPTVITVPAYSTGVGTVPQKDTTNRLDSISDRVMSRLAYRNWGSNPPPGIPANTESLVVNHTVNVGGPNHAGVRWYEIRNPNGTPTAFQAATYSPDTHYHWMGSAAQDRLGNLAVGYSVSSSTMYPSIRYAGRLQGDALNTLQAEASMFEGPAPAPIATATSGDPRWGDYTNLTLDPIDDCTFWYINEYYVADLIPEDDVATKSRWWHTRIGSFKFDECTGPTAVSVSNFGARWRGKRIAVTWRTASETDALGFNVYRRVEAGPYRKVNRTLIPAKRSGQAVRAAYSLLDRRVVKSKTYTYRLQLVERSGKRSWYGIGAAAVG